jgi:hypothetical protein
VFHQGRREVFLRRFAGFQTARVFIRDAFFAGMRSSLTADAASCAISNGRRAKRSRIAIDVDRELSDAHQRRAKPVPAVCC